MDYLKIYKDFIDDRKSKKPFPFERHHIAPKSMGGTNAQDNIICLSPKEHLFAHCLLARIYKGKMVYALNMMLNIPRYQNIVTNKKYRLHYAFSKNNMVMSKETKQKISASNIGKQISAETRKKISIANQGRKQDSEWVSKRIIKRIGISLSSETKNKIREKALGKTTTEETRNKISIANKGKKKPKDGIEKSAKARQKAIIVTLGNSGVSIIYESGSQFANFNNIDKSTISYLVKANKIPIKGKFKGITFELYDNKKVA